MKLLLVGLMLLSSVATFAQDLEKTNCRKMKRQCMRELGVFNMLGDILIGELETTKSTCKLVKLKCQEINAIIKIDNHKAEEIRGTQEELLENHTEDEQEKILEAASNFLIENI